MDFEPNVHPLDLRVSDVGPLIREASAAGFPFMETLRREWADATNRFNQQGEAYLGVYAGGTLVAAGGINRDPYSDNPRIGRVRHVYVLADYRRSGVGQVLLAEIITRARHNFDRLRLRTRTSEGAAFYESIGFARTDEADATHTLAL